MISRRLFDNGEPGCSFSVTSSAFRWGLLLVVFVSLGSLTISHAMAQESPEDSLNISADEAAGETANLSDSTASDAKALAYDIANKGVACYNAGNYACAWASFDQATGTLPEDPDLLYTYADLLAAQKKYDEALGKIDAAIELDPNDGYIWFEKGSILNSAGRYTESGPSFDRAEALDPDIRVSQVDRFPLNLITRNMTIIVLITGFALLGAFIYFKERG
jgi:tetratricopeptide (TPR) repeat protein